ncbi:flagellar attachment zone protein 1-like isoform X2 [Clupea harengus]|uniref:Flagellar attachment zone protein 1-like isoform X2 n=1 Tax=Clupea harengus TaxID=7950 RepID=A0A6P8GGC8_CLUHA|nr:flagellar attachment zone protein 1-like isoform X2 [Clupea harengus]
MKTSGALLVLLCCCLAETQLRGETISENDITHQGHSGEAENRENEVMGAAERTEAAAPASTQQTCQPDIHAVLREMSALMAEQRVELRYTKTQMEAMETRQKASENKAETVETRLRASENKAETLETRLRASEKTVEEQRVDLRQTDARLTASERLVERLQSENEAQTVNLNLTVSQVEELRREREERRVSFSASLVSSDGGQYFGPFSRPTTLIYRHVFTNTGNAYNPNTGVFTAPVRGVYHFSVFMHGTGHASIPTGVSLHKNEEHVVIAHSHQPSYSVNPSNGASLLLEVGDVVYVKLWPNAWVYDSYNHHTTFSGHLLFPM